MTFYEMGNREDENGLTVRIAGISFMNPDMCLAFYVHEEDVDEVMTILDNADAEWWDSVGDTGVCHAEYLEEQLDNEGIAYEVEYTGEEED